MEDTVTLSAQQLTKRYGQHDAVHAISLQLKRGEVLGLLGHNGAGKSTTLRMLAGVLAPSTGSVAICGHDLALEPLRAKAHLGYLPETPPLYREMRVDDYLAFAARLHRLPPAAIPLAVMETRQRCGLENCGKKIIATLSKGYQQRLGIAQAIIHQPDVIVLDEPTVGLDPAQIRDIRNLIRELGDSASVILSTHLLGEVEQVCDRVEIMQNGRLIYGDTSARMQQYGHQPGFVITLLAPPDIAVLRGIAGVNEVEALSGTRFRILHEQGANTSAVLLAMAAEAGWQAQQLTPLQGKLEDVFMQINEEHAA